MNLERHYTNKQTSKQVVIDVGSTYIKIGFIQKDQLILKKCLSKHLNFKLLNRLFSYFNQDDCIYIGANDLKILQTLINFFHRKKIKYVLIKKTWFLDYLKLNPEIKIEEIGIDILAFCFYFDINEPSLIVNLGTGTVFCKCTKNYLHGVLLANDICSCNDALIKKLHVSKKQITNYDTSDFNFSTNTIACFHQFNLYMMNGLMNEISSKNDEIKTIYLSGGNLQTFLKYFKNEHEKTLISVPEATIYGYFKLLKMKNLII